MNREQTAQLLAVVQTYDQRTVGQTDVISWHGAIGDLSFDEARDATVRHYSSSTDRVMPAHIRRLVTASRQDRAMRSLSPARDDLTPMPDWFASTYAEHRNRARASRELAAQSGEPVTFGSAIILTVDGMGAW